MLLQTCPGAGPFVNCGISRPGLPQKYRIPLLCSMHKLDKWLGHPSLSLSLSLSFPETKASVRILRCRYTSHPGSLFSFTISLSSRGIHPMHMHIEEAATYSPNKSNRAHSFLPATMKPKTGSRFREREEEEEEEEEEEGRHKRKR